MTAGDDGEQVKRKKDPIITITVGGMRFQTRRSTLARFPNTLLGSKELEEYFVPDTQEYFFDRNRAAFEPILYYYQSNGIMCLPSYINPDVFIEELKFFKMDLAVIRKFVIPRVQANEMESGSYKFPIQKTIWQSFSNPSSSNVAKFIGYFDQVIIVMAVVCQCLESLPAIRLAESEEKLWGSDVSVGNVTSGVFIIEAVSITWFTLDLLVRLITCPDKIHFVKSVLNWFDLLAVIPFYLDLLASNHVNPPFLMVLRFFRTLRIVRIFKISRYFQGLFALGYALKHSAGELVILTMMLTTFVALFSSLIFFTEECGDHCDDPNDPECEHDWINQRCEEPNQFDSVVAGFWWSIVTMSTVGYGDYVPKTPLGKVVGSLCALTGILVISLPFPIIITNFNRFMKISAPKSREYSTIDDGFHSGGDCSQRRIPEYSGIAYGFAGGSTEHFDPVLHDSDDVQKDEKQLKDRLNSYQTLELHPI